MFASTVHLRESSLAGLLRPRASTAQPEALLRCSAAEIRRKREKRQERGPQRSVRQAAVPGEQKTIRMVVPPGRGTTSSGDYAILNTTTRRGSKSRNLHETCANLLGDRVSALQLSGIPVRLGKGNAAFRLVRRGTVAATACAVVGSGVLVAVLSSGSQHRQTPESLRLSLWSASRSAPSRASVRPRIPAQRLSARHPGDRRRRAHRSTAGLRAADDRRDPRLRIRGPTSDSTRRLERLYTSAPASLSTRHELDLALDRTAARHSSGCRGGADWRASHDVPRRRRHRARRRLRRPPLLQRPDARELQRRPLGRSRRDLHVQQHRRARHRGRPPVVRDRRRSDATAATHLPYERRSRQRATVMCGGTPGTTCSSCIAHRSAEPERPRGLEFGPANQITRRDPATRASWATTRSAPSRRRRV